MTASGTSCVTDEPIQWSLAKAGAVVSSGSIPAGHGCPGDGAWSVPLGNPSDGTYTFVMVVSDAGGAPLLSHSTTFTVGSGTSSSSGGGASGS